MKNTLFIILFIVSEISCYSSQRDINNKVQHEKIGYLPKNGFVPDSITAIKIAEAIWLPIFGNDVLDEKPYRAILENDSIWRVFGTFKMEERRVGGTAYIEIQKRIVKF
jgi:hypothetical protein